MLKKYLTLWPIGDTIMHLLLIFLKHWYSQICKFVLKYKLLKSSVEEGCNFTKIGKFALHKKH